MSSSLSLFIEVMNNSPWLFTAIVFIFSAVVGSFLNVVIHRFPVMMKREWHQECCGYLEEYHDKLIAPVIKQLKKPIDEYPKRYNIIVPGSSCPKCKADIKPWHNLPILGWLLLGGKCANCKTAISKRYPLVELLTACMVSYLALHYGPTLEFVVTTILTLVLICLTGIDLDEMLLPDQLTLPLLWLGLLLNINGLFTDLNSAIIGAVAGYLSLWSVFWGFKLLTGKEGMGYGDFKLMALFGAWFGWQLLPLIILLSSIVGAIVGIGLIITKKIHQSNPIPFGPYIALAGWIAMLWGEEITQWYLASLY